MRMRPNKAEIRTWFESYMARAGKLVDPRNLTPDGIYMLMGAQLSWDWDIEDVGLALNARGEPCCFAGLYQYLDSLRKENIRQG